MKITEAVYLHIKELLLTKPYQSGFASVSFTFLLFSSFVNIYGSLSFGMQLLSLANTAFFLMYSVAFLVFRNNRVSKTTMKFIFILDMVIFFSAVSLFGFDSYIVAGAMVHNLVIVGLYFILLLLTFTFLYFGWLLLRRNYKILGYSLLIIPIISILLLYSLNNPVFHFLPDDEVFITFADAKLFLQGMNPYTADTGKILYSNYTLGQVASPTFTTSNRIVGVLNYPALWLFLSVPFYLFLNQANGGLPYITSVQISIFIIIMLLIVFFSLEKKHLKNGPLFSVVLFLAYLIVYIASPLSFLMLGLLVFAYARSESKYLWLILGICASLQELLWIPVILFIIYSINNQGWRKGVYNLLGTCLIFLIINSYFIALNPGAFLKGIFNPLNGNLFAVSAGLGYFISIVYGTQLSSGAWIFALATLFTLIIFAYLNKKKLVGVLSILPFMFITKQIENYAALFVAFTIIALFIKERETREYGTLGSWLRRHKIFFISSISVIILAGILAITYSHAVYLRLFNATLTGIKANSSVNEVASTMLLHYAGPNNNMAYIGVLGISNKGYADYGFFNQDIIDNPVNCTGKDYNCEININRIFFNKSNSTYTLSLKLHLQSGESMREEKIVLYNNDYLYESSTFYFK